MAINIKDPETDALARELAGLMRQPITTAIREALQEKLTQIKARQSVTRGEDLHAIIDRGRSRPTLDDRTADEILGYGPDGVPE